MRQTELADLGDESVDCVNYRTRVIHPYNVTRVVDAAWKSISTWNIKRGELMSIFDEAVMKSILILIATYNVPEIIDSIYECEQHARIIN